MSNDAQGPNAKQIAHWSEITGPRWVAQQAAVDAQLAPMSQALLELASVDTGDRVLDVGCGCGQTLLELGERVGAAGRVVGVDVSPVMLARAEERVRERGLDHVEIVRADAQTHAFDPAGFDHVTSRYGVMFFADPTAAFSNLRRALAPGGALVFACWQSFASNPWMALPMQAVAAHVTLPAPPPPGAPGPYSFANSSRVQKILTAAGFSQIDVTGAAPELPIGDDIEAATELCLQMGPAAMAVRLASERGESIDFDAIRAAIRSVLEPFVSEDGVRVPSASWLIQARA